MATPGPQPTAPRRSRESTTIGSFTKVQEIGRGSFATVYKAVHVGQQKDRSFVAIKSVNLAKLNKKLKDNLTSEIAILKGLHHPHIVGLIDCKESTSHIHLIMEFVALGDLSYFIKKRDTIKENPMSGNMMQKYPNPSVGGLNEVVVRHFLHQLSSALQFLRLKNLIHRDVKPQNLLLNPSPYYFSKEKPSVMPYAASDDSLIPVCGIPSLPMLKIADFGFARSLPSTSMAETLCGSPLYMAPEILRYEKYDAKADLWSVGTVLYEMMTGKPPFRASNHVELLRTIEKGEDKIKFHGDIVVSEPMQKLIRSLLKRDPKQRMSFPDFFGSEVIVNEIPGLAPEDQPAEKASASPPKEVDRRRSASLTDPTGLVRRGSKNDGPSPYIESPQNISQEQLQSPLSQTPQRQSMSTSNRPNIMRRFTGEDNASQRSSENSTVTSIPAQRPQYISHATAPGRQELLNQNAIAAERQRSRDLPAPTSSLIREQVQDRERNRAARSQEENDKERAAQDIAFERDYVLVEKRAVEVNAFADELEASPRMRNGVHNSSLPPHLGAMVRRATTQGTPASAVNAPTNTARAGQMVPGRAWPDQGHNRQNSYERRYGPSPTSATSAISKALTMASGRLFGIGFSPPISIGRGSRSPPIGYNPFPVYPTSQGNLLTVGDIPKAVAVDEDTKFVQSIEEVATRSDVVYGFAEVKYRQLLPTTPSAQPGLNSRQGSPGALPDQATEGSRDDGLTIGAIVTVSEEALVLYVKALSLLAKSMDIAGGWWARKNRGEIVENLTLPRSSPTIKNSAIGTRMNNVVQWVRGRFNEVLEKAEVVRLKLVENQNRLPPDHPSHPSNHSTHVASGGGMGTSVDHVVVSSGITAEKLMYDRALEMSRSAAINELTGEDLPGCEISYVTAIRMLEAVLESDENPSSRKASSGSSDREKKEEDDDDDAPVNGLEAEDRKTVKNLVASIRVRLGALKKKLQIIQKRASAPAINAPAKPLAAISHRTSIPAIATTPPK